MILRLRRTWRVARAFAALRTRTGHYRLGRRLSASDEIVVMALEGDPPAVLKVATSDTGKGALARQAAVVGALTSLGALVPVVLHEAASWLVETRADGIDGSDALMLLGAAALTALAVEAIRPLHESTASSVVVDDAVIDEWFGEPLRRLVGDDDVRARRVVDHARAAMHGGAVHGLHDAR